MEHAPQEIVPGLYRLRTPMTSNALPWIMPYAFTGDGQVSLFDSGYGTAEASTALTEQLEAIGYQPSQIRRLIVSHAHPDHLGMAGWVKQQAPEAELVMLSREWQWSGESRHDHDEFATRTLGWLVRHGVPRAEVEEGLRDGRGGPPWSRGRGNGGNGGNGGTDAASRDVASETERRSWEMGHVQPDVLLNDGDVLEFDGWRLQAVWTPGHTPGHLCMFETNHRLMLTGDHILSRITPNVSLSSEDEAIGRSPLAEFLDSLEKVAAFDTALALPAHEELIEDLPARCAKLREHHDERLEEVLAGIGSGQATASDVSEQVTWNKPYSTFNVFKKRSALGETLSHLQLLADHGRIARIEDGEQIRWEQL